jgi:hypothetical protein
LPTKSAVEIRKRCITRPTEHQQILLQYLKLKLPKQFNKKNHQKIILKPNVVKKFTPQP